MTQLAHQTVLVTGANRGMGRSYVTQLLDRGVAKVYPCSSTSRTPSRWPAPSRRRRTSAS
jgi:NAD(P)-dependent dehydrogenase (short-subunit alcohol dehydrogenase family)